MIHLGRYHLIEACNQDMKTELSRGSPIIEYGGVFGEVFIKHVLANTIKKGGPLEEIKIVII